MTEPLVCFRRRDKNDDNMIPMINIVFLLLIFFMVAGHISADSREAIELPEAQRGQDAEPDTTRIAISASGGVSIAGTPASGQDLENWLSESRRDISVALMADKSLKAADLDPILDLFRQRGMAKIRLLTLEGGNN